MGPDPKLARVWELAEPIALEAGLEIVEIEHRREGRGAVLRVLIDRPGGVSLDDLTAISRQVSDVLDVDEGAVPGSYILEVSSPGINRPLTRPAHFVAVVGKRAHVRTRELVDAQHSFHGVLESVGDDGIVLRGADGRAHAIPFALIIKANYEHDFAAPGRDRKPARRPPRRARRRPSTR